MAEIEKKTKRYPTDLTDEEWARIEPFLPGAAKSGRPARTDLREVFERDPISGPLGRRLADVAEGLSALADGLLVVSPVRAALPVPDIHDLALMLDRERV